MVQLVSAPVMTTVPVGVAPVPLTETPTTTDWPGVDESGTSPVMLVVLGDFARITVRFIVPELVK
jgi:hypothetical protein